MRGVGGEAPLALERVIEPREQAIERRAQVIDLLDSGGPAEGAHAGIDRRVLGAVGHRRQLPERPLHRPAAHDQRDEQDQHRGHDQAAQQGARAPDAQPVRHRDLDLGAARRAHPHPVRRSAIGRARDTPERVARPGADRGALVGGGQEAGAPVGRAVGREAA